MTLQELADLISKEKGWERTDEAHAITFSLAVREGRHQRVRLQEFRADNISYVRFISVIGSAESTDLPRAESALGLNAHLTWGAVAVLHNELILTETMRLGSIRPNDAISAMVYLAHQADRYESVMFHADQE